MDYSSGRLGGQNARTALSRRRVSRRSFLIGAGMGVTGLAAAALIGCGSSTKTSATTATAGTAAAASPTAAANGTSAATAAAAAAITRGGKLTLGVGSGPLGSLDPHRGQGGGDHKFFWTMFDGLVNYNRDGIPDPTLSLAKQWEIVDPTTIRFHLRQGIKFHDGTPFNADAVKFNIDRIKDPKTHSTALGQIQVVDHVEVVDEQTPVFHLTSPDAALITLLGDRGGQQVSPTAVEKLGDKGFDRHPVGTGAFTFVDWVSDQNVRVKRNPNYWLNGSDGKPLPYLDQIEWLIIPDPTLQLASLDSGQVDEIAAPLDQVTKLQTNSKYNLTKFVGAGWSGIYFNLKLAPTDDIYLRKAIAYATDREADNKTSAFGLEQIATGIITPALKWVYQPVPNAPTFDLAKAKALMSQSQHASGAKITMTTGTSAAYGTRGALWQQMLKAINVDVTVMQEKDFTNQMWVNEDRNTLLAGFSLRADPDGTISEVVATDGFYNAGHVPDPPLDAAIKAARESYDLNTRKSKYAEVEALLVANPHDVYSTYDNAYEVANKTVGNLDIVFGAEGKEHYVNLYKTA